MEQTATLGVEIEQNPLEKLSLDVVKGTKKQLKRESQAVDYYYEQGFEMGEQEFDVLIKGNSKSTWLNSKYIHDNYAFGPYFEVPESYEETVLIYVVTFPHKKPGCIQTSFYIYNGEKLFRTSRLDRVQEIIDDIKLKWLSDFRFYVESQIKDLQEEKGKSTESN